MRRAALALLLALLLALTACAPPATGAETERCDSSWRDLEAQIVEPGGVDERAVPIECLAHIGRRRIRVGFTMPGGPDCHRLSRLEIVESADAVSVTVFVSRDDSPTGGACAPGPVRVHTEADLQDELEDRALLDGSGG